VKYYIPYLLGFLSHLLQYYEILLCRSAKQDFGLYLILLCLLAKQTISAKDYYECLVLKIKILLDSSIKQDFNWNNVAVFTIPTN
jgi:hypothetical protein